MTPGTWVRLDRAGDNPKPPRSLIGAFGRVERPVVTGGVLVRLHCVCMMTDQPAAGTPCPGEIWMDGEYAALTPAEGERLAQAHACMAVIGH